MCLDLNSILLHKLNHSWSGFANTTMLSRAFANALCPLHVKDKLGWDL